MKKFDYETILKENNQLKTDYTNLCKAYERLHERYVKYYKLYLKLGTSHKNLLEFVSSYFTDDFTIICKFLNL